MADWPGPEAPDCAESVISATSREGACAFAHFGNGGNTVAWIAANRALFFPFRINKRRKVYKAAWGSSGPPSGNIDIGVYSQEGTRLASTGATAAVLNGNGHQQIALTTALTLAPGLYYLALAIDNAVCTIDIAEGLIAGGGAGISKLRALGVVQMAAAFPLPATATFAAPTGTIGTPTFGIATRADF